MSTVQTAYGAVTLEKLIHVYEIHHRQEMKNAEKRKEFLQTEEGKKYNRDRAKVYYEKNKELVRAKARARYAPVKRRVPEETPEAAPEMAQG